MLPRALALLAVCAALAAALPLDQYDGDSLEESQQSYAEPVDERQERAAAPWGEEDDLGQHSQQYQQSDDLAQESQQYQQSDDLTQDTQQSDDFTQDTQQSDDLTQDTQQSDDFTQDSQQSDDLTQESQQSDDLTQDTQQYQQSDDLSQETQQSDDISQYSQQTQQEFQEDQWSKKPPQRTDEGLGRSNERLTDSRGSNTNSRDNTGGNTGNTGNTGDNWGTGNNGNNNGPGDNGAGNNGAGNNGAGNNGAGNNGNSWENGGNRNNGDNTSGFPGSVSVDRPTRPLTPPPDYKKLPPNAFTPLGHYKVYTVAKTWVEAVVTCAADAAELAIAASQQEASEMGKLYKEEKKNVKGSTDKELFFVGASDLAKENDFVTLSGQHFQDGFFFRWQKGEPNNHRKNEHCVLSNEQGLYWDGNCNAKFAFMCRFKTDPCARPPLA